MSPRHDPGRGPMSRQVLLTSRYLRVFFHPRSHNLAFVEEFFKLLVEIENRAVSFSGYLTLDKRIVTLRFMHSRPFSLSIEPTPQLHTILVNFLVDLK